MKTWVCLIVVLSFLQGCDIIYRYLDKEGAEEKDLVGEVLPFERNPTVEEIQIMLKIYGYDLGRADGILGGRTRNAIERFQKDNELEVSRFVDDATWSKLKIFKEYGLIVEGHLNGELIQQLLVAAGHNVGLIDGNIGPKTTKAVKDFQKEHNLKVDGKIGYKTLTALSQYFEPMDMGLATENNQ